MVSIFSLRQRFTHSYLRAAEYWFWVAHTHNGQQVGSETMWVCLFLAYEAGEFK